MIHEFGRYVRDAVRNQAYAEAISRTVRPGDVVADLGTGFGLLAMLAARAGARRVYAIEQQSYIDLARDIAQDNGLADRIVFLAGNSLDIALPEPVDVLVSEILGPFALEEYVVGYVADARRRWLAPGGRMVPMDCSLWVQPVELPGVRFSREESLSGPWRDVLGFDLERLRHAVVRNELLPYTPHRFAAGDRALGPPGLLEHIRFAFANDARTPRVLDLPVTHAGRVDGVMGWFDTCLAPGVHLSSGPDGPQTHWTQVIFHLWPSLIVDAGDRVRVRIGFGERGVWTFEAAIIR